MPNYQNTGTISAPPGLNVESQGGMYNSAMNPFVFEFLRNMSMKQQEADMPKKPPILGSRGGSSYASPADHSAGGMFGTNPARFGMGQRQLVPVGTGPGRIPGMGENPMDSGYNPGQGMSLKPQGSVFGTTGAMEDSQRQVNNASDFERYLREVAMRDRAAQTGGISG